MGRGQWRTEALQGRKERSIRREREERRNEGRFEGEEIRGRDTATAGESEGKKAMMKEKSKGEGKVIESEECEGEEVRRR